LSTAQSWGSKWGYIIMIIICYITNGFAEYLTVFIVFKRLLKSCGLKHNDWLISGVNEHVPVIKTVFICKATSNRLVDWSSENNNLVLPISIYGQWISKILLLLLCWSHCVLISLYFHCLICLYGAKVVGKFDRFHFERIGITYRY